MGRQRVFVHVLSFALCFSVISEVGLISCSCIRNYSLPAGKTIEIKSDLAIKNMQTVEIEGDIIAIGDNSQSITIEANGDITIAGRVIAGHGKESRMGGTITILSKNGDILIKDTGVISAGDGSEGRETMAADSAGATGGSVILRAPKGSITIPDAKGVIKIGNGGRGADIKVTGKDLLKVQLPEKMPNAGGNSGDLILESSKIVGLDYKAETIAEDITNQETGEVIFPAGKTLYKIRPDGQLSGGIGGDAGALYYGVDERGNSTYLESPVRESLSLFQEWKLVRETFASSEEPNTLTSRGADGGEGIHKGGSGGNVHVKGQNGRSAPYDEVTEGDPGQNVKAVGGNGGNCISQKGEAGKGGNATAWGGSGGDGADFCARGGDGGQAYARGGNGGYKELFDPDLGRRLIIAPSGSAYAFGGRGGRGGGHCPDKVCDKGGQGGLGGYAEAHSPSYSAPYGTQYILQGDERATGGAGGNGGDGDFVGGNGGAGGVAFATIAYDGQKGSPGKVCSPPEATLSISGTPHCFMTAEGTLLELDLLVMDLTNGKALITDVQVYIDNNRAFSSGSISTVRFPPLNQPDKVLRGKVSPGYHLVKAIARNSRQQTIERLWWVSCGIVIIDQPPTPGPQTPTPSLVCPKCGKPISQCTCPK